MLRFEGLEFRDQVLGFRDQGSGFVTLRSLEQTRPSRLIANIPNGEGIRLDCNCFQPPALNKTKARPQGRGAEYEKYSLRFSSYLTENVIVLHLEMCRRKTQCGASVCLMASMVVLSLITCSKMAG